LPAESVPVLAQPKSVANAKAIKKHISNILFMALSYTANHHVCFVPPFRR
jgi:hypothetical protein